MTSDGFTLTKWYLDCVDDGGRAAIAYWVSVKWKGLGFRWHSVTVFEPDRAPRQRSSLARGDPPARNDGRIAWDAPALQCVVEAEPRQGGMSAMLIDDERGAVEWRCEAPATRVRVELAGEATIEGVGYVERITLTVPPWRLPIDELRWGRWIGADASRSIVWIVWRGSEPRTWVFVDGQAAPDAVVSDTRVSTAECSVELTETRTLEEKTVGDILSAIPPLRAVVPAALLGLREVKWVSRGALAASDAAPAADAAPLTGWAIHERAVFR